MTTNPTKYHLEEKRRGRGTWFGRFHDHDSLALSLKHDTKNVKVSGTYKVPDGKKRAKCLTELNAFCCETMRSNKVPVTFSTL